MPTAEIPLRERTNWVWHVYLPDVRPPQLYGYRVDGPWDPARGHRFNPRKLLVDPYARALAGEMRWSAAVFGHRTVSDAGQPLATSGADAVRDEQDSAPWVPRSLLVDSSFPWVDDRAPRIPWANTVIYECHVKGMTIRHPDVPARLRGTYLGLASEPVVSHLRSLGVTAVELLPVHHAVSEQALVERGLVNYWGYNTLGFFAPDSRFSTGGAYEVVREFKSMVKTLHESGIEVLLDVVYNHTCEGDHDGPTLCFRGIDNASYYHLDETDPRRYVDYTGCGNTLNTRHPRTLQLLLDSLRYWVSEMHVDGFRFDLAPALARELHGVGQLDRFFATLQQDPVLAQVKLIAEPWDLGPGGYQVGNFPNGWAEWNGPYRDTVRRYWRGDPGQLGELASRMSGSADFFQREDRSPLASVNFVTSHDGFTLRDLVSYEHKHNEANGEQNRDGNDANWSLNFGVEGETGHVAVRRRRRRTMRSLLATLAFSQGVPMLSHGDEMGRTQHGNNNAYCQDNETSWVDWELDAEARELLSFTRGLFSLRERNPVLRRRSFFSGRAVSGGKKDVTWLRTDGQEMTPDDWHDARSLGMLVPGDANAEVDERGRPVEGETLLLLCNAGEKPVLFRLPSLPASGRWELVLCSEHPETRARILRGDSLRVSPGSLSLLTRRRSHRTGP